MTPALARVRGRLTARGGDAGVSLVELLVVSVVSLVILSALGVTFSGSLRASQTATAHVAATAEARLAADTVARRLRVAIRPDATSPVLVEAGSTKVTFWASLSADASGGAVAPSLVSYSVVGDCLVESVTRPATPVRTTCLARGEVSLAFAYHEVTAQPTPADPTPTAAPTTPLPFDASDLLLASDLDRVRAVQVDLGIRHPASTSAHPVRFSTRVLLVNRMNEDLA